LPAVEVIEQPGFSGSINPLAALWSTINFRAEFGAAGDEWRDAIGDSDSRRDRGR
jgi:hypothetical protein